jgi:hypothetical protein
MTIGSGFLATGAGVSSFGAGRFSATDEDGGGVAGAELFELPAAGEAAFGADFEGAGAGAGAGAGSAGGMFGSLGAFVAVGVSGVAGVGVDSSEGLGEHELKKAAIRSNGIHLRTLIYSNLLSVLHCLMQQGGFHSLPKTVTVLKISDFHREIRPAAPLLYSLYRTTLP